MTDFDNRAPDFVPTLRDQIEIALSSAAQQARLGFSDSAWDTFCRCASEAIQHRLREKIMDDDLKFNGSTHAETQIYLQRLIIRELRALRKAVEQANAKNGGTSKPREGVFANAK